MELWIYKGEVNCRKFHSNHAVVAITLSNEGIVCLKRREYDDAIVRFISSLETFKKSFVGEDMEKVHPWDIDLPALLNIERKPGNQSCLYEECFGEDRQAVASLYNNIGNELLEREMYDDALRFYEKSIEIKSATIGKRHRSVATTSSNIANLFRRISKQVSKKPQEKYEQQSQALLQRWEATNPISVLYEFKSFLLAVSDDQGHDEKEIRTKLENWQENWYEM